MREATESMKVLWQKISVDAIVLKGLEIAKLYPVPEHRSCGDVDWYFRSENGYERAFKALERLGVKIINDSDGSVHYRYRGQLMEHHVLHMDPQDKVELLCMYNEHILKHAMVLGVGMRQFCDLAMAYNAYSGNYNAKHLALALKNRKILQWTALLNAFLVRELKMDPALLPELKGSDWEAVPQKDVDKLMRLVLLDGNFGFSKKYRIRGFLSRYLLFRKYAPYRFAHRLFSLAKGRVKKHKR